MVNFFCCASSRKPSSAKGKEPELLAPSPPVRLPGTHALAPPVPPFAQPTYSAASVASMHGIPGPSSLAPARYPYLDPGDLVIDDSEDEAEIQPASQTKGGSTTSLVQRIRKQFSTDALPRKKEPAPIIYTPEELAWRAQLKRSRNQRIRLELQLDNELVQTQPNEGPSKPRLEPNPSIDLSGGGPRDCLEFTLDNNSQALSSRSPPVSNIPASDAAGDPAIQTAEAVFMRRCSSIQGVQTHTIAEVDLPRPEIVYLHQMDIHRRLTIRVTNDRGGSSAPSEPGNATVRAQTGNETSAAERNDQNPEDDMDDGDNMCTEPSSIYTYTDSNQDPSPEDSSFQLPQPHASWKNSLALLGPGSIYPGNPFRRDSYPPVDEGSPASPVTGVQTSRQSVTPEPAIAPAVNDMNPQVVESPKSVLGRLHLPSPKKAKLNPRSFDGSDSADQQGPDSLRPNLPERDGSAGEAGRVVTRDSAGSERRSCSPRQQVVKKDSQSSLPGRLGSAIWSGLSKLIPSRVPAGSTSAKAAEGGQFELDALRRQVHSLQNEVHRLREVAYPVPAHQSGGFGTLRTTARADGSGHSSSAAGSLASVQSENDLAVERNIRRQFAKMGGNLTRAYLEEEDDDAPSASASGATQPNTWNGRSSISPALTAVHTNTPVGDEGVSGPSGSGSGSNQAPRRRLWQGPSDSPPLNTGSYGSDSWISAKLPATYSTRRRL